MTRSRVTFLGIASATILLLVLAAGASAGGGPFTELISVDSSEVQGNNVSDFPSLSTDGRYVAFYSSASNLVPGDTNGYGDVFVRDWHLGLTERVSVTSAEGQLNGSSGDAAISADGRWVAFESRATNAVTGDTNGKSDVFVRDRVLGTTVRVSRSTGGTQGNGDSEAPSISADGRYVAFQSDATNLVGGDTNSRSDVFVHDLVTGVTTRVSVANDGSQANDGSMWPSISADGRYVAFQTDANNLWGPDTNGAPDIYMRDRVAAKTIRVSVTNSGYVGNDGSWNPSISADGRYVAFQSDATDLVPGDTGGYSDIFVNQTETGITTRVSVNSSEVQGNGGSYFPFISANSRFIAFVSSASNLVTGDTNGVWDVFVRDREAGTTSRQSISTSGTQANGASSYCGISTDGRVVGFRSEATNLVTGDVNGRQDVFARINSATTVFWSIRGSDRYDTAIRISQAMFPVPLPAGSGLVLAPGESFQEALCGAPLAAAYGGPVLLTPSIGLNNAVKAEILRLGPDYVTLIGLDLAMQEEVDTLLGGGATVYLIRGTDVYDMSYKVAMALDAKTPGGLDTATALITRGDVFPDAIALSPLACYNEWPVLLTGGGTTMHPKAAQALSDFGISSALKAGTYVTLPAGVAGVGNCSGVDRYETARNVAEWGKSAGGLTYWHVGVTTGDKFPDALASGPLLAQSHGVLLLSPLFGPLPLSSSINIYNNRNDVGRVTYFAMIEPVITMVKALVR